MKISRHGIAYIETDTHISKWAAEHGTIDHGQNIEQKFRRYIREGDHVVDVGAFIGDHTVPYAQIVGPDGHVTAFEPCPDSYACLLHNTQNYPWVNCINQGLSNQWGTLHIVTNPNAGANHLTPEEPEKSEGSVRVQPLDELGMSRLDFMKIDVEGLEVDVLAGAADTIKRCRPSIHLEVSLHQERYGRTPNSIFQWLVENLTGYTLSPPTHTGQPQYDLEAIPHERVELWNTQGKK
jgi:FkbM family methyltransferase